VTPLVLASGSPRRRALLEALGIPLTVRVSDADETLEGDPIDVAVGNARLKRDRVAGTLDTPGLVIAADTIVVLDGEILGKPHDLDEARALLRRLSGRTNRVITGIAVVDTSRDAGAEAHEVTEVTFRKLRYEDIDRFVEVVRPLDRAGAYTSDGPGSLLVASYNGCYHNVLGLPVPRLDELLRSIGDGLFERMHGPDTRFL